MARVLALVPDLLFGSNVQGSLTAAGHEVELASGEEGIGGRMAGRDVLVVDLTTDAVDGVALVEGLRGDGTLAGARTLGVYAHVDVDTKRRADAAGFDLVVPRSRMAREGGALVTRLAAEG
ncbi:MAG TPA: hypothetical protein VGV36_07790 [Solirubrobacteraceae bacterium]|nr:hypothetical protein [Solirubrobacteraceae bacterium]